MFLKIGIVGCGMWGQKYVRVFEETSGSGVVAICDEDTNRLNVIRQRYSHIKSFKDYNEFLAHGGMDAVVVATPASAHFESTKAALLASKHVLVEKPFVLNVDQGVELVELSQSRGLCVMVGHVFLYCPGIRKLKEYVHTGNNGIGQIYYLYAIRTNLGPIRNDVNVVWDLATHDIAIFSYLLDHPPVSASANASKVLRNSREDVAFINLTYPDGIVANIHVSWADPNRVRQLVIVGSEKRVVFDDTRSLEKVRVYEKAVSCAAKDTDSFGEFVLSMRDGDIISPRVDMSEPLKNQAIHFLECIQDNGCPLSDGKSGLDVVKTITAIQKSIRSKGAIVEVPK